MYQPFRVGGQPFGGLALDAEPDSVGSTSAIDMLNCELDSPGSVRSRDGFATLTAAPGATRYDSVGPVATGTTVFSSRKIAGSGTDVNQVASGFNGIDWTSPGNVTAENGVSATVTLPTVSGGSNIFFSDLIDTASFGFAIPGGATIKGIVVEVKKSATASTILDDISGGVRLLKAGVVAGDNRATTLTWPLSLTTVPYGNSSDLWNTTWTPADINAAGFGVRISAHNNGFGTATASVDAIYVTVYYALANTAFVLAGAAGSRIDAINFDGSIATTVAGSTDEVASYANFGSPSTASTYMAVGVGNVLRKYSGGGFSTVANSPKCRYLAVQSPDNRLFCANITTLPTGSGASSASTSLVHISDAGLPEVFSPNNFVYLTPGDGEDITGAAAWRELVFVFKLSKFFVFYGNGTDSTGNPVFNYRPVTTGTGLIAPQATAASPDGLYFLDRRGVYLTNGGPPVRVSSEIDPLFLGGASSFYTAGTVPTAALTNACMTWHNGRLYVGIGLGSAGTNDHTLVYDPQIKQWLLWDMPMRAATAVGTNPARLVFAYGNRSNDLGQYAPNSYTDDAGTPISSLYRSGFYTVGNSPSQEATVRESLIVGQGSPSFSLSRDFEAVPTTGGGAKATVTLGTPPATTQGRHRVAQRGRRFSYQIEGSSAWRVDSITNHVREFRPPGEQTD